MVSTPAILRLQKYYPIAISHVFMGFRGGRFKTCLMSKSIGHIDT